MPSLQRQEHEIFYTVQVRSGAKPLLLIHGAGGSHLDWSAELRRLPSATVYTIDLPGHGRSSGSPRDSITAYAADVVSIIRELKIEDVVIAGYSMGGAIALELGLQKLSEISGLVLISTGARLRVNPQIFDLFSKDFRQVVNLLAQYYWSSKIPEEIIQISKNRMLNSNPEVFHKDLIACNRFDRMGQCGEITLPALVINGDEDNLTPPKYGRYLAGQLPNARLVKVPGASHMVFLERTELVANEISDFIAELGKMS